MTNKIITSTIAKLGDALSSTIGIIDDNVIFSPDGVIPEVENNLSEICEIASENGQPFVLAGYTFCCPAANPGIDYIYFAKGADTAAAKNLDVLMISINGIKKIHDEKFDKFNFMKNVILDNILTGDLMAKAKDLRIAYDQQRIVFLVKTLNFSDLSVHEILQGLFPDRLHDFVVSIDENTYVLVKEINTYSTEQCKEIARSIISTLSSEAMCHAIVGIGTVSHNITTLAKSYKDASVALEVGKVFDTDKDIVSYDNLGIARLIYHLPTTLCELFLSEVFKKESIDVLDQETIYTIQKFFENNLNVSETSRQLYVHRNTLVYRLDKVQKLTGLDLRIFEHAIIFKVAMMVKKYLTSNPIKL